MGDDRDVAGDEGLLADHGTGGEREIGIRGGGDTTGGRRPIAELSAPAETSTGPAIRIRPASRS